MQKRTANKVLPRREALLLADPRLLARSVLVGLPLILLALCSPLVVRLWFGTITYEFFWSTLGCFGVLFLLGLTTVALVFRWLLLRGVATTSASIIGCIAAAPAIVATYLGMLVVQRFFPGYVILDPSEPKTISFQTLSALADSLPLVSAWGTFFFLPTLWRAHSDRHAELVGAQREAELLRLRSHLEPHFVLNTMNAIAGLVTEDPGQARDLLGMLGDVFRDATQIKSNHTVQDEVNWLSRYIDIHALRFPDRFTVTFRVAPETLDLEIPALILQPLVENALFHGVLRGDSGELSVGTLVRNGALELWVSDNGPRLGDPRPGGKGLSLVQRRLALHGDGKSRFELTRHGDTTRATVHISGGAT
jgi:hypothetical protein